VPLVEQELLTLPEHLNLLSVFSGVRVPLSLVLCVMFCRSLFVLSSFFLSPLFCLYFFNLRILIAPLVSSKHNKPQTISTVFRLVVVINIAKTCTSKIEK